MSKKHIVTGAALLAALAVPGPAQAHVTLQPSQAAAGAFTVLDVRVPTERDDASTAKVDVQFPAGFASVSYQAVPGWRVRVLKARLATPIQTDDGPITEGVKRMIWTRASRTGGGIKPGQFQDFPISVQIPGKAGEKLTFKALQTYSDGQVVRWIGAPGSDHPAPQVSVTAAVAARAPGHGSMAGAAGDSGRPSAPTATTASSGHDEVNIGALALGALGLLFGAVTFALTRRTAGSRRRPASA